MADPTVSDGATLEDLASSSVALVGVRAGLSDDDAPPSMSASATTSTDRFGGLRHRDVGRIADLGVLALALALGAWLRLADLAAVGLNSDEAVYSGQAAALAGNPHFVDLFPIVRAHPLLFQVLISPFYANGVPDLPGRYVNGLFGVGTIALVFVLGRILYGRRAGAIAALLIALMPYHVIVTRQVLLDGPMTFFATAALVCLALLATTSNGRWLVAAGACLGVAALTKETALILVMAVFLFLALVPRYWRPVRYVAGGLAAAVGLALMYPLVTALSGGGSKGQSYLAWQLSRRPNHDFAFYFTEVPATMGVLVIAAAVVGLLLLRHRSSWRETLLLAWIAVPFVFFEVWPVKGFPYLLVLTPALVVLAARALASVIDLEPRTLLTVVGGVVATVVVAGSLLLPSYRAIAEPTSSGLAGAGGAPGGREAGLWVAQNVPADARLMSLGPSMGNVVQYYSGRRVDGLSVSPDPLHRNPSYLPITNPDSALRKGIYRYVIWDAYSARRSPSFAARELAMVRKYAGRVVHTEYAVFDGQPRQPVVVIYEVSR